MSQQKKSRPLVGERVTSTAKHQLKKIQAAEGLVLRLESMLPGGPDNQACIQAMRAKLGHARLGMDRDLVIALIGASRSGKSPLIAAMSGSTRVPRFMPKGPPPRFGMTTTIQGGTGPISAALVFGDGSEESVSVTDAANLRKDTEEGRKLLQARETKRGKPVVSVAYKNVLPFGKVRIIEVPGGFDGGDGMAAAKLQIDAADVAIVTLPDENGDAGTVADTQILGALIPRLKPVLFAVIQPRRREVSEGFLGDLREFLIAGLELPGGGKTPEDDKIFFVDPRAAYCGRTGHASMASAGAEPGQISDPNPAMVQASGIEALEKAIADLEAKRIDVITSKAIIDVVLLARPLLDKLEDTTTFALTRHADQIVAVRSRLDQLVVARDKLKPLKDHKDGYLGDLILRLHNEFKGDVEASKPVVRKSLKNCQLETLSGVLDAGKVVVWFTDDMQDGVSAELSGILRTSIDGHFTAAAKQRLKTSPIPPGGEQMLKDFIDRLMQADKAVRNAASLKDGVVASTAAADAKYAMLHREMSIRLRGWRAKCGAAVNETLRDTRKEIGLGGLMGTIVGLAIKGALAALAKGQAVDAAAKTGLIKIVLALPAGPISILTGAMIAGGTTVYQLKQLPGHIKEAVIRNYENGASDSAATAWGAIESRLLFELAKIAAPLDTELDAMVGAIDQAAFYLRLQMQADEVNVHGLPSGSARKAEDDMARFGLPNTLGLHKEQARLAQANVDAVKDILLAIEAVAAPEHAAAPLEMAHSHA